MSIKMLSIFLLVAYIVSSQAQNVSKCVPSSCGDIENIASPFRLRTDPQHCGEHGYELDCENNNQTIFNFKSRKFYVQEINYKNFTIRLLDPGLKDQNTNCTVLPNYKANYNGMTSEIFEYVLYNTPIAYVNCQAPVNASRYIPTRFCSRNRNNLNSNSSSYLVIGDNVSVLDLKDTCSVETEAWSSARDYMPNELSLSSTHRGLAYGFELSWKRNLLCRECHASRGFCELEENSDKVTCRHYCYEDTPISERSFRCKMEYYSVFVLFFGGIGLGGLVAVRFLLGLPILIAVVVWQCKRRNLLTASSDDVASGDKAGPSSSNEQNC